MTTRYPPRKPRWEPDDYGVMRPVIDVEGMTAPVQCPGCRHVHDSAAVAVIARYADCSRWFCPGCERALDDRRLRGPEHAIRLDRAGRVC